MPLKTRKQIREEFARKGWSYTGWARSHRYTPNLVIEIINDSDTNPRRKCLRGESHNVAVQLGLKEGEISRAQFTQPTSA